MQYAAMNSSTGLPFEWFPRASTDLLAWSTLHHLFVSVVDQTPYGLSRVILPHATAPVSIGAPPLTRVNAPRADGRAWSIKERARGGRTRRRRANLDIRSVQCAIYLDFEGRTEKYPVLLGLLCPPSVGIDSVE